MTEPGLLRTAATALLLALGCLAMISASVGILRFPDFYSRIHPAGKSDTLGIAFVLAGLMVWEGFTLVSLKLLIILVFMLIASPTATHALAKAAYQDGVPYWKKGKGEDGA
ncbi:MAG: monovalent cation/H(+) antiporter subunit G [Elusimicrobiales bacterium]|nr:monovalent cation/H(+) antiporter subunit G [Elusimicrobiales bacterium]